MAESTKKTPRSKKSVGRLDRKALTVGSTNKISGAKQTRGQSGHEASMDDSNDDLETFVRANEAIMNVVAALSSEMLAFGNKRLRENIERSESLVDCKDAEQAFRIQCEFVRSATQQYLEQTTNMLSIMTKMTANFWSPFQASTAE